MLLSSLNVMEGREICTSVTFIKIKIKGFNSRQGR